MDSFIGDVELSSLCATHEVDKWHLGNYEAEEYTSSRW